MSTEQKASPARRVASVVIKTAVVVGLLYVLAQKGFVSLEKTAQAYENHPWLTLAGQALLVATALIAGFRWWGLLRAQDVDLPLSRTLQLSLIGNFFNIALPGAISGDMVKAYYVGRDVEGRRARVFGTIFFDRVVGVSALALVCAGAQLLGVEQHGAPGVIAALKAFVMLLAAGVVGFYAYLFLVPEAKDLVLRILRWAEARVSAVKALTEFYLGMRHYHSNPWAVLRGLALSGVIHLMAGLSFALFAWAMGDSQLTLTQVYGSAPLGFLVTTIPVAPAGVGTGHAAFLFLLQTVGSERGADCFTLFAMAQFFTGGLGGLVYLRFKAREPAPVLPAA